MSGSPFVVVFAVFTTFVAFATFVLLLGAEMVRKARRTV
jgi:hypothetical protein